MNVYVIRSLEPEKTFGRQKSLTFDRTQECERRAFLMFRGYQELIVPEVAELRESKILDSAQGLSSLTTSWRFVL